MMKWLWWRRWVYLSCLVMGMLLSACGRETSPSPAAATAIPTLSPTTIPPSATAPVPTATIPVTHPDGRWSQEPPLLQGRAAHAVVSSDTAIYVLGGTGELGRPVLEVEQYDGTSWTVLTMLPGDGLNAPTAVVLEGHIYVIGGFNTTTNVPVAEVQVYDLATGTWAEVAPLPAPRGGHASVMLQGQIHVFGGGNSVSTLADHSVYDPASDTWRDLAPLPRAEGSPAGVVYNGQIYAIGGRSGPSDFGDVYIYDAAADSWRDGPAIEPRGTAGAVAYCAAIYLVGGESQAEREVLATMLRLDPVPGAWAEATSMPTARSFARAVHFQEGIYVVGGSTIFGSSHASVGSTAVERFHLDCADATQSD
ncbi:MAG: hypothetical protein IPL78_30385 [Chloroflexi bacterium]|nr:hypothetical protein [Chloroflexota bacterium]